MKEFIIWFFTKASKWFWFAVPLTLFFDFILIQASSDIIINNPIIVVIGVLLLILGLNTLVPIFLFDEYGKRNLK